MEGIDNLKKILVVVYDLGEALEKVIKHKDWSALAGMLPSVMHLPSVEWSKLDDELKDLTSEEKKQLVEHCQRELDLQNDAAEEMVEKAFELLLNGYQIVLSALAMVKK